MINFLMKTTTILGIATALIACETGSGTTSTPQAVAKAFNDVCLGENRSESAQLARALAHPQLTEIADEFEDWRTFQVSGTSAVLEVGLGCETLFDVSDAISAESVTKYSNILIQSVGRTPEYQSDPEPFLSGMDVYVSFGNFGDPLITIEPSYSGSGNQVSYFQ